ncbi:MAG: pilus assembly protein CpaB [Gemmatimonadales bacterium]|jgi:pilus assembly protein CpaB|nr:pilus assembly protein CpaB [Gemmatimonadales bacterium]
MRKSRPWFMLLLALTSGVVAALLALRYLRERTTPLMASEPRKASIVLSARSLPVGALLTERDLKVVSWPGDAVPSGYIRSVKDAVGRGVITPVAENEPLLEAKVSTKDAGGGLSIIIRDGMRAVSVRVDEVIGVAGFVIPGTRVDVMLTLDKGPTRPQAITKTLLQNVQTLAAGQSVTRDKEGKPQTVTVITLLVTPDDAELLALAAKEGRLQLALRNTLDTLTVATSGARADKLSPSTASSTPNRPQRNRSAAPPPRTNPTVVEGYRGGERTLTTFQKP